VACSRGPQQFWPKAINPGGLEAEPPCQTKPISEFACCEHREYGRFPPCCGITAAPATRCTGSNTLIFIWTSAFLARIPHPAEVGIRAAAAILFDVAPRIGKAPASNSAT
jgi:hypothetical protein